MASIFKTLDDLVTNVSEKINKDKWDRSALNPALLEAANEAEEKAKEEERLKHFQNQLENRVPVAAGAETVGDINTVVCAEAPASTAPASDPNATYAGFSDMEMLLTPPDLPVKPVKFVKTEPKEEPVAKGPVAIAPVPTVPVKEKPSVKEPAYIKPVFKSRFSGPKKQTDPETTPETTPTVEVTPVAETTPVETIPTYGAHPTIPLSDLPVIDPSQSLSAMIKKEEEEEQPLTSTILAHTSTISEEASEEQPVEEQIEEQKEETPSVPVYPEEPAEAAPAEVTPESVPAGLQGLYGTVPETVEERTAEQQLHTAIEKPVEVTIEPAAGKPVEKPEEATAKTEAVKAETVSPVVTEDKKNPCYYILIKHTKTYPEKGSLVMMRSCDHEYAWTNKQDESEKPTYDICPGCGKPISYTSTEID